MNTLTGESYYARFGGRGLWQELLLAGNIRDTHYWREIVGGKCGFLR